MVLDRLGSRLGGVADGLATAQLHAPIAYQLAQVGCSNVAALGDVAQSLAGTPAVGGVWVRGIGSFASVDRSGAAPGFDADRGGFLPRIPPAVGHSFRVPRK